MVEVEIVLTYGYVAFTLLDWRYLRNVRLLINSYSTSLFCILLFNVYCYTDNYNVFYMFTFNIS